MLMAETRNPIIVCAADDNYAMQLAVVIRSSLEYLSSDRVLTVFVVDGGIKKRNKTKILKSIDLERCSVTWLPATPELLGNVKISKHVSIATYFRILIPFLIPEDYQKVIYLDSDVIVKQDLGKLWDIDIADNYALAAQQSGIPYVSSPFGLSKYKEMGISADEKYFNAGVLVINLKKWRSENISNKVIEYLNKNREHVNFWDQDGLNAILVGKWKEIEPRWNQTPEVHRFSSWQETPFPEEVFNNLVNEPYIIHFASSSKPWNSRKYHPANSLFFKFVDMTAWSGWRFTTWKLVRNKLAKKVRTWNKIFSSPSMASL